MQNRNYFTALAGLKLDDSPANSPTAAAAGSRCVAAAASSSVVAAEPDTQQEQQQPSKSGSSKAAADGTASDAHTKASDRPKPSKKVPDPLVWIDLEMTGLDPNKDTIIEIACLVTDGNLQHVYEGPSIAIHHPEEVLENMNDWCKEHHAKSGLVQRVRDSTISLREAEQQVLAFVQEHTEYQAAQLAGNSVHVDRVFLQHYMPELLEHLHYRILDVSTLKECCRRWRPKVSRRAPRKVAAHTALSDIKESLRELQYYKQILFKGG